MFKQLVNMVSVLVIMVILTNCSNSHRSPSTETDWKFNAQREEIEPAHWVENDILYDGQPTLAISGEGKAYANGSWTKSYEVTSGKYYEFNTLFKPENITQLDRTIFSQIIWKSSDGKRVDFIEFPAVKASATSDGWYNINQTYKVPAGAVEAKIDLFYRWDAEGSVYFGGTSFKETDSIKSRIVRLGAIHHQPKNTGSSQENLEQFKEFINIAGEQRADIVCLPEGITVVGTGKNYLEVSETIPGPSTLFLGQLA